MDTVKLWFALVCVYDIWILSLAADCDWTMQYENKGKCCQVCPSGEYPTKHCSENNGKSVCGKCPAPGDLKCFCPYSLCRDDKCSGQCIPRPTCLPGFRLIREGKFDYTYNCKQCPDGTYRDDEDGTCKSFAKCDGLKMIFAGNKTHNARCACHDDAHSKEASKGQHRDNSFYIMMGFLTLTIFLCLLLILYMASMSFKHKKQRKLFRPCTHKLVLPLDACNCKLSKEEMGDDADSKTSSEFSVKFLNALCDSKNIQ